MARAPLTWGFKDVTETTTGGDPQRVLGGWDLEVSVMASSWLTNT